MLRAAQTLTVLPLHRCNPFSLQNSQQGEGGPLLSGVVLCFVPDKLIPLRLSTDRTFRIVCVKHWLILVLCFGSLTMLGLAAELKVGDAVPGFAATDQFGKDFKFEPGLHFLLLGFDMSVSKEANRKLAELGTGWLEKQGAAYVLDIHTMPAIGRFFALPKMRKYPERIILAEKAGLLAPFPHQPEKITVLVLSKSGAINEIRYWDPATDALSTVMP